MSDVYNHHLMAKAASNTALRKWREACWSNEVVSPKVRASSSKASFPSPDATFYDEKNERLVAFEFKPPTGRCQSKILNT